MRTPIARTILIATALLVVLGATALTPAAGAHGDEGVLAVLSATTSGTSATITVELTYEGDGHPVDGATVTLVGDGGDGTSIDPVPMVAGTSSGQYTATVQLPSSGTWSFRVTSVSPAATITTSLDVAADPGVTVGTEPEVTAGTEPSGDAAPTTADPALDEEMAGSTTTSAADDDASPLPWIGGAVVLLGVIAVAVVAVVRGRRLPVEAPPGSELPEDVEGDGSGSA